MCARARVCAHACVCVCVCVCACVCANTIHVRVSSPAVSEEAVGLGVVGKIVPEGATSVVSVGTCACSVK